MIRTFSKLLVLAFGTFALQSVWAQDDSEASEATEGVEEVEIDPNAPPSSEPGCFSVRGTRNFRPIGDEFMYVESTGSTRHFLLTMDRGCFGLRGSQGIAIDSHMDRVCSNSQARVTFRGSGRMLQSCRVMEVEAVESRDAAITIAETRQAASRQQ